MKKRWLCLPVLLLLALLLVGCAAAQPEDLPEAPAQSAAESGPAEAAPAEEEALLARGYSLEELGFSVVLPQRLLSLNDPNSCSNGLPYFDVSTREVFPRHFRAYKGNSTEFLLWFADGTMGYDGVDLCVLQGYRLDELAGENVKVLLDGEQLDVAALQAYQIWQDESVMLCDLTDLYYSNGFSEYAAQATATSFIGYDYSWIVPVYEDLHQNLLSMICTAEGEPLLSPLPAAYTPNREAAQIWAGLEGWWNGPSNRFVSFAWNADGKPVFCSGLYDADGGRGYGTVTGIVPAADGSVVVQVFYPEHPEDDFTGYLPAELVQLTLRTTAEDSLTLQYADLHSGDYSRAGNDFDTAYQAYTDLYHS